MPKRLLLLITALTGITYGLALFNGFVGDDEVMIVRNDFYRSLDNLPLLFSDAYISDSRKYFLNTGTFNSSGAVSYRPVNSLSYFLDRAVWELNPFGYHLHNWLLHLANTALVFALAFLVLRQAPVAAWSAALFGTHPLTAEAVCAVSYRHDLQACFFSLMAILLYIRFRTHGRRFFFAGSLVAYLLAVFSKESAILLPFILLGYEFLFERRADGRERTGTARRLAAFAAVTVFYLWTYLFVFPNSALGERGPVFGHPGYILILAGQYLTMWLLPMTVRPLPGLFDPRHDPALMANPMAGILLIIAVLAVFWRSKDRDLLFFVLLSVVFYLPASNIITLVNPMAHRFMYLPLAGLCVLLMLLLDQLNIRMGTVDIRRYLRIGLVAAGVLTSFTVSAAWKNNLTLANSWTKDYPRYAKGHAILGIGYFRKGDCDKASSALRQAVLLGDRDPRLFYLLGRCAEPDDARAAAFYRLAIQLAPDYASPYRGLGQISALQGDFAGALAHFTRSIDIQPTLTAYQAIRRCLRELGRRQEWDGWLIRAQQDLSGPDFQTLVSQEPGG